MSDAIAEYAARQAVGKKRQSERKRKDPIPQAVLDTKIIGYPCRVCRLVGVTTFVVEAHHIVPQARFHGAKRKHSRENLMPVCKPHHVDHHTLGTGRRIPRAALWEAEAEFAFNETSEAWLDRWYPESLEAS